MNPILTVYKASAGSGKTFTLAVEYIALLLAAPQGDAFRHTLAVTFTNKATAEMKDRILQQLYAIGKGLPEGDHYLQAAAGLLEQRGMPADLRDMRRQAQAALSGILHDYNYFRVETIDSFFQSVMRSLAHELGLPPNLEVELNTADTVSRAVDQVIDNMQYREDIQQWVLSYVTEQIERNERWDVTRVVKSFARCIFEERFQNRTQQQRAYMNDEARIRQFRDSMRQIEQQAETSVREAARVLHEHIQQGVLNYERISRGGFYQQAIQRMMEGRYDPESKTLPSAVNDPRRMLRAKDKANDKVVTAAAQLAEEIGRLLRLYAEQEVMSASARLARKYVNPMRLLGCIEDMVQSICNEKNQIMLSQTPTLLSALVEGSDAPFVFEKIGTQFHNVMIDEFQDTSRLQWKNFRVLLLENQSVGGHDLLVGDVKQSIYRWRNGDWSILDGIQQEMSHLHPQVRSLKVNYRSSQQVVDFNNAFFPKAATLLDTLQANADFRLADIYSDVVQECKKRDGMGYVSARLFCKKGVSNPEGYDDAVVDEMAMRIEELLSEGVPLSDMAILVRTRRMGTRLIALFGQKYPGIRLVSDEAFLLQSSVAVGMIVNALRVLDDTQDTNPIPLHYLVEHYLRDVEQCAAEPSAFAPLAMQEKLPQAFLSMRDELCRLPLVLLCERLYRIFCLDRIPGQEAYLCAFYDEMHAYLSSHPSDIHSFLEAWDEQLAGRSIPCGQVDGIQVMTIHQSKGLQFHTVMLPCTEWDIEMDRSGDLLWCTPDQQPFDSLGLLPITPGKQMATSIFSRWYEEEHLQRRVDALNTLYVAFTRAESNLMIWGLTTSALTTRSLAGDLLYACVEGWTEEEDTLYMEQGSPAGRKQAAHAQSGNRMRPTPEDRPLIVRSFEPRLDFRQSNESIQFVRSIHNEDEGLEHTQSFLELGKILHYVLSQVRDMQDVERVVDRCQSQGLIADASQRTAILRRIRKGLDRPLVASWFATGQEVFNECSITRVNPDTGIPEVKRPDRVVINGNCITVVDFKFGRPYPEHAQQVATYMQWLHMMYPTHTVKGYLWYVYTGQTPEVYINN